MGSAVNLHYQFCVPPLEFTWIYAYSPFNQIKLMFLINIVSFICPEKSQICSFTSARAPTVSTCAHLPITIQTMNPHAKKQTPHMLLSTYERRLDERGRGGMRKLQMASASLEMCTRVQHLCMCCELEVQREHVFQHGSNRSSPSSSLLSMHLYHTPTLSTPGNHFIKGFNFHNLINW